VLLTADTSSYIRISSLTTGTTPLTSRTCSGQNLVHNAFIHVTVNIVPCLAVHLMEIKCVWKSQSRQHKSTIKHCACNNKHVNCRIWAFDIHMSVHHNILPNCNQQDATFHDLFISTYALHVSGGSSAHHQEDITVHTASGIVNQYCCLLLPWLRWKQLASSISSMIVTSSSIG